MYEWTPRGCKCTRGPPGAANVNVEQPGLQMYMWTRPLPTYILPGVKGRSTLRGVCLCVDRGKGAAFRLALGAGVCPTLSERQPETDTQAYRAPHSAPPWADGGTLCVCAQAGGQTGGCAGVRGFSTERKTSGAALRLLRSFLRPLFLCFCLCFCGSQRVCATQVFTFRFFALF